MSLLRENGTTGTHRGMSTGNGNRFDGHSEGRSGPKTSEDNWSERDRLPREKLNTRHTERDDRTDDGVSAQLLPIWLNSYICPSEHWGSSVFHVLQSYFLISCSMCRHLFVLCFPSAPSPLLHVDDSHNKPVPVSPAPACSLNFGSLDGSPL